ncbi:MAG: CHAT domain-containing protein, partial [Bacteroidota bacterium]
PGLGNFKLGQLLYNVREVEAMQASLGGEKYTGEQATREQFLKALAGNSVFHLSAHSLYNDRSPLSSAIYFSSSSATEAVEGDDALFAFEIYARKIDAELGILTSCDSGFGAYRTGEGLVSLRRAFYFAGCRSLVASLWQANDRATFEVARKFGEQLALEKTKDEALRNAKLEVMKENPAYRHPFYWANLTLSGTRNPLKPQASKLWLYIILSTVALTFFIVVLKRRKSS